MTLLFKIPDFLEQGITIAITGYVIVFAALVVLFYVFTAVSKILLARTKRHLAKEGRLDQIKEDEIQITGEVSAAIAMALYLHTLLHDEESGKITIKKISKTYTPWSSKIYGMSNFNR
ncbi:MAG: OadG family protein [Chlorobi bacterium]|nr:OadG family protein [Chlorobiota bacterium]